MVGQVLQSQSDSGLVLFDGIEHAGQLVHTERKAAGASQRGMIPLTFVGSEEERVKDLFGEDALALNERPSLWAIIKKVNI